jgi:flagellar biosynthetic protein FlhB
MQDFRLNHLNINLQLFAEKTEKPTAKKKQKAAKQGQLVRSTEINSVVVLLATFFAIKIFAVYIISQWTDMTDRLYRIFAEHNFTLDYLNVQEIFLIALVSSAKILAPIVGGAMLGGMAATYAQVGFKFSTEVIKFNLDNINPISGMKRLFSAEAIAELVKSVFKLLIVAYIAYSEFIKEFMNFSKLSDMNLQASSAFIGQVTMNMVFKIILWMVILAVADYVFQRWRNQKKLMMTKEETKEEHKRAEGDPQIKGKIRAKQRQMSMARMMQALPKADVVITNPTHFAVALKYDSSIMGAPLVIAKGQDRIAEKIKEVAREHNIVIVENKPLAQSLFHSVEIGESIPGELFQAVAEVLAFVYKLKGKI